MQSYKAVIREVRTYSVEVDRSPDIDEAEKAIRFGAYSRKGQESTAMEIKHIWETRPVGEDEI